jgi:asparagine synthase (glutamine-hydrolysing)
MCGIFALLNYTNANAKLNENLITNNFDKGISRGPESSTIIFNESLNYVKGFHRLAINGLNKESNQPLNFESYSLICNGEIYNYKQLYKIMNITPTTDSDCEVIIHLYLKYGIYQTLRMLDGVFAFVLFTPDTIFVARDPYGVRPLYLIERGLSNTCSLLGFTSELKTLSNIANGIGQKVNHFLPGSLMTINKVTHSVNVNHNANTVWKINNYLSYHTPSFSYLTDSFLSSANIFGFDVKLQTYLKGIYDILMSSVTKRYVTTERPIACLLSGGLDSSLIAAIVCSIHKQSNRSNQGNQSTLKNGSKIETYSIGLPDSEDIKYARLVADYIGSKHTEIIVSEQEMLDAIPEVIVAIESYDTTSVRASIGNYLIGKYINAHSEAKVIFNGDGSDELCGGYLYMSSCPDSIEYDKETLRLLKDIYLFDVLRSDKSISSHGLEPRTPFLDKAFVNYYLSIPLDLRNHNLSGKMEKYLLRMAFEESKLLPPEILWRKKEAFSDGVSNKGKSLFTIIQDHTATKITDETLNQKEKEKKYYKDIFDAAYPNQSHIVPYFWMPKYINSDDPSARTLTSYK